MANGTFGGGDGSQGNPFLIEDDLDAVTYFSTVYKFESYAILVNNVSSYRALGMAGNFGMGEYGYETYLSKHFDLGGYKYEILRELNGATYLISFLESCTVYITDSLGTGGMYFYFNKNNGSEFINKNINIFQIQSDYSSKLIFERCTVNFDIVGNIEFFKVSSSETQGYLITLSNNFNYFFYNCNINVIYNIGIITDKSGLTVNALDLTENFNLCYISINGSISVSSSSRGMSAAINMNIQAENTFTDVRNALFILYLPELNCHLTVTDQLEDGRASVKLIINSYGTHYIAGNILVEGHALRSESIVNAFLSINGTSEPYEQQSYVNTNIRLRSQRKKSYFQTGLVSKSKYVNGSKILVNGETIFNYDYVPSNIKYDNQMKDKNTFSNFYFIPESEQPIWGIDPAINEGYPYLLWYTYPTAKIGLFVQGKLGIIEIPTYSLSEVSGECIKFNSGKEVRAIKLVATTNSNALPIRVQTSKGIMSLSK